MKRFIGFFAALAVATASLFILTAVVWDGSGTAAAQTESKKEAAHPVAIIQTSAGAIKVELWPEKAPKTVENFLRYSNEGFYNGTIFHRVIKDFMIQGGGITPDMAVKKAQDPIKNEAKAELKNERGTIAMARTGAVDSATCQFFINLKDNPFLNHKDETPAGFGYTVFGKVVEGMDVVDAIGRVQTTSKAPHQNVPEKPIIIESVKIQQ